MSGSSSVHTRDGYSFRARARLRLDVPDGAIRKQDNLAAPVPVPDPNALDQQVKACQHFGARTRASQALSRLEILDSPPLRKQQRYPLSVVLKSRTSDKFKGFHVSRAHTARMRSFFQFITTPTADTFGTAIVLHFDSKRYLVGNIGEGTQRANTELALRLIKVANIFLTGKMEWESKGGLMGMFLSLAATVASSEYELAGQKKKGKPKVPNEKGHDNNDSKEQRSLTIFGPRNLNHTLATARSFVFRAGFPLVANEITDDAPRRDDRGVWQPTWQDENIKVWAMSIAPSENDRQRLSTPTSPKKRTYDEFDGTESASTERVKPAQDIEDQHNQMTRAIVSEMFSTSYRLDALVEMPLAEVQMPATLFIRNPETSRIEQYVGPVPGGSEPLPDVNVLLRRPWPGALIKTLPPTSPAKEAISYIIRNHPLRGRFRPDKARSLKVEQGQKWAQLTNGISVLNVDGEIVSPEMVLESGKQGGGAAVLDLPSLEYVETLIKREEFRSKDIMDGVHAFIWLLGPGVASSPALHQFMNEMSHIKHIVSSKELCPNRYSMDAATTSAIHLNQIDPSRFPIPLADNLAGQHGAVESKIGRASPLPDFVSLADRGQIIQLEPSFKVTESQMPSIDVDHVRAETPREVLRLAEEARDAIAKEKSQLESWRKDIPNPDAEIITLGTGSSLPSKLRNVSATLVRVPGHGSYLLDCGEDTLGQLQRMYTPSELLDVLQELRMIWISHLHADHHMGTISVIKAWYAANFKSVPSKTSTADILRDLTANPTWQEGKDKRLVVVSETKMLDFFSEYAEVEDYGYSRVAPLSITGAVPAEGIPSLLTWHGQPAESPFALIKLASYGSLLGLADIQAVFVNHCRGARAVTLTFPSGFKVSYSGDCRPNKAFSIIGSGSTVLIHEATFDDDLKGDAVAKKHSTTSEALAVAAAMKAKTVILTHFSQRYAKIPVMQDLESGEGADDAGVKDVLADVKLDEANLDDELDDQKAEYDDEDGPVMEPIEEMRGDSQRDPPRIKGDSSASSDTKGSSLAVKVKRPMGIKVCVAFDLMRVKVGEIPETEKYTPALLKLYERELRESVGRKKKEK